MAGWIQCRLWICDVFHLHTRLFGGDVMGKRGLVSEYRTRQTLDTLRSQNVYMEIRWCETENWRGAHDRYIECFGISGDTRVRVDLLRRPTDGNGGNVQAIRHRQARVLFGSLFWTQLMPVQELHKGIDNHNVGFCWARVHGGVFQPSRSSFSAAMVDGLPSFVMVS